MTEDSALLTEFLRHGSEAAFRQVVERHLNLVYSCAMRIVNGDAHLAQDVAQVVFLNLARKAASLPPNCVLAGWLHRDTRFTSLEVLRKERRRVEREREAATMYEVDTAGPEVDWSDLRPMLDEVLDELDDDARHALLLRIFEQQSLARVGAALGLAEDSVRKRVSRALDQLRGVLGKRGIHSTTDALVETLGSRAVTVAPAGLLAMVVASVLTGATTATASAAGSSLVQLMLSSKVKLGLGALVLASLLTPLVLQNHANTVLRRKNAALQAQVTADSSEPGSLRSGTRQLAAITSFVIRGTLDYEGQAPPGRPLLKPPMLRRDFEVFVTDCVWKVKVYLIGNTNFNYFSTTYDGTNIIYFDPVSSSAQARLSQRAMEKYTSESARNPNASPNITNVLGSCVIEPGPVPRSRSSTANAYIWLAFASGCYFKTPTNGAALDLNAIESNGAFFSRRQETPVKYVLNSAPPFLPIEAEYISTNLLALSTSGQLLQVPIPPVLRAGFVSASLKSQGFTNVDGQTFPTKFEMRENSPLQNAKATNDVHCDLIVRGEVKSISIDHSSFTNEIASQALFAQDLRISNAPPQYVISNGVVPSVDDPSLANAKAQALLLRAASHAR
jgi:RNA polymerase sigma factor (sigma-70 family)